MSEESNPSIMPKNEMKKATKEKITNLFALNGCDIILRSAGAVDYQALRFPNSKHNVACVYGGRGVAASIWVKGPVFESLKSKGHVTSATHNVEDVSFFKRGLDWKIDIKDMNDPVIPYIVAECIEYAKPHYEDEMAREVAKEEKRVKQEAKKAAMDAKRKDPFA